ncbi:MAG TPA: hypothetical protein VM753_00070 [Anaeromyxobacter sp.]|jgi:hypothetical protein|nr:hypothetical protein [Anaeromyxobacter sp.]
MSAGGRRIYVCCWPETTTGGPEALHQLVDALRRQGVEAYISYYPFSDGHRVTPAYARYDVVARAPEDVPGALIVVPESLTSILRGFSRATPMVWWLSIDFYFGWKGRSRLSDAWAYLRRRLKGKCMPFRELRRYAHAAQSEYARAFLGKRGIDAVPLSDYLNDELLVPPAPTPRNRTILYNPKKGLHTTRALMARCPDYEFRALAGLTRTELRELLGKSMVYIDFGNHPGKDRMPREAAASGCVVITNRRGSAGYVEDVGIPEAYKIDDTRRGYEDAFRRVVEGVFHDFERSAAALAGYTGRVRDEKRVFFEEAAALAAIGSSARKAAPE